MRFALRTKFTNRHNKSRPQGSGAKNSFASVRDMTPYPYCQTPSRDPPSQRKNPKVDVPLSMKVVGEASPAFLTLSDISTALAAIGYADCFYTVNYVHCWADASLDAIELSMYDVSTGVEAIDNGAVSNRARVGLNYPPVLQVPRVSTDSTAVVGISTSTGLPSDTDLRVGVTVWNRA